MSSVSSYLIILFLLSGNLLMSVSQVQAQLSDEAKISVITCRPGDDIYNTFGHTAIRVVDPVTGKDELYNYGIFDFRTPGFTMKFLRGKLSYYLGLQAYRRFLAAYDYEKRSVLEQELRLDPQDKNEIYKALSQNYLPENRAYLYDFFFDNCSTRPRDIILQYVDSIKLDHQVEEKTFRELLDEYTFNRPWTDFGIDLIIGSIADRTATVEEQMFLPEYLFYHLEHATVRGEELVAHNRLLRDYEAEMRQRQKRHWFTPVLVFGILLLIELWLFSRDRMEKVPGAVDIYDRAWYCVLGVGSLIICFLWFATDHIATKNNLNLLWMNPLYFVYAYRHTRTVAIILLSTLILSFLLSPFIQDLHGAAILVMVITSLKLLRNIRRIPVRN